MAIHALIALSAGSASGTIARYAAGRISAITASVSMVACVRAERAS